MTSSGGTELNRVVRRGEIYLVDLSPAIKPEFGFDNKIRPVLVLSVNLVNKYLQFITVIPGTSRPPATAIHTYVEVLPRKGNNGLDQTTYFLAHHYRTLSRQRFVRPSIGVLSSEELSKVERAVRYVLGLPSPTPMGPSQST